jgi:hypothetical protein
MNNELEIIESEEIGVYNSGEKAAIDIQVATAKQYPRSVKKAIDNSIAIATLDKETAETCTYSLPRGGKKINGPSVHLARIIAQNWQNLRIESKVVGITQNQVISEAVCFDLETNYAVKVQVRKNILQNEFSNGNATGRKVKMNEDMITVTGNAANAIAYRNAVFAVIPKAVTDKVYSAAKNMITGDLSTEEKLIKKRKAILDGFLDNYTVTEDQILEVLGLRSVNQIKQDEIAELIGLAQAIKDGDTTIFDTFGKTNTAEKEKSNKRVKDIINNINIKKNSSEDGGNDQSQNINDKKDEVKAIETVKVKDLSEAKKLLIDSFGVSEEYVTPDRIDATALSFNIKFEYQNKTLL